MENKDFDTIMQRITSGLTGDTEKDILYLQEQMEKYRDHEMHIEILRACGRLLYDLLPDDRKEQLQQTIDNDLAGCEAALEEARFALFKKDYGKAEKILEPLVKKVAELNAFQDDAKSEYHVFDEMFERVLYSFRNDPEKEIRDVGIPFAEIYLLYGSLLVELGRIEEAREMLGQGLRWNPVSFRLMSEYMETFKMTQDLETFFTLSLDAFKIAYKKADVARCFRNLGYYFVEKQLYPEAMSVYYLSLPYDKESGRAQSELFYIQKITDGKVEEPDTEQLMEYADRYGFPLGADRDVVSIAYSFGKHFLEQDNPETAGYFLGIANDLGPFPEVDELLKKLPQQK